MMEKFTNHFQSILSEAQSLAVGNEYQFLEPSHILLALLADNSQLLALAKADINRASLKALLRFVE